MEQKFKIDPLWIDKWGDIKTESEWLKDLLRKRPNSQLKHAVAMFEKLQRVEMLNDEIVIKD